MTSVLTRATAVMMIMCLFYSCSIFHHSFSTAHTGNDSASNFVGAYKAGIYFKSLIISNIEGILKIDGRENSFTCSIKSVKDSLLVVSVQSLLGIEVFRIIMNDDSVYIIDRTKKEFELIPFKSIVTKFSDFLDIRSIKDILLGNLISDFKALNFEQLQRGSGFIKYGVLLKGKFGMDGEEVVIDYILNSDNLKPVEFSWKSNRIKLHVLYTEYRNLNDKFLPGKIEILIKSKDTDFRLNLEIGNLKEIESSNTHISLPDGYKKKL